MRGFQVRAEAVDRVGLPALMLSEKTQVLMREVFDRDELFAGLPRIETRVVAWGRDAEPRSFPHSAVIVSEQELLARLRPPTAEGQCDVPPDWTILASRPFSSPSVERRYGSRVATLVPVGLTGRAKRFTCWIESVREGWLFLIPGGEGRGWLLAVGGTHHSLLTDSRLVSKQIQNVEESSGQFPAYPAMADPFCGPGWLACGSAALSFDPLCGDGTGNAIREAILATAVIRAAVDGAREEDLREHYRSRLLAAFLRHLKVCRQFYGTAHNAPWWKTEVALIDEGIEFCHCELASAPPFFRYRLRGYDLQRL